MSEQQPVQPDHGVYDEDAPADVQPDYTADHVTLEEEQ